MIHRSLSVVVVSVAAIATLAILPAFAGPRPHIAPIQSRPHGQTYSEWAAEWWQVAVETPASVNPWTDETGEHCDQGKRGNVWFLFGSLSLGPIERTCAIPAGTALFFPLINLLYGAFLNDPPEQRTEEYLRGQVACVEDAELLFEFNDNKVNNLNQFFEESVLFDVQLPEDNIFGFTEDDIPELLLSPSVDAGFYLFVHPLPPGDYRLHWEASSVACDIMQDITYNLTITEGPRQ
jgi:hypothetical protein